MQDIVWLAASPDATVLHAVPVGSMIDEFVYTWYELPGLPPCQHCINRLTTPPWRPDPTRPPGHYAVPPRKWPEPEDPTAEQPIILIPATPVDKLEQTPFPPDPPVPATPLPCWKFATIAEGAGAAVVITYARAIIPPHTVKSSGEIKPAYLVDSFAVRFRRAASEPGTFPHRPGVVGYAMWERRQNKPGATFTSAGAGYRNAQTQGQFPGLTELSRLLKEGLL